jgi:4-hydroxy-tetrahydrodipicolinate synthase
VQIVNKRIPVVAATGSQSYEETLDLTERAERAGADALLIVTPYYIKPPQAGLVEYYTALGEQTGLPVMIYHIPGRAAVSVTSATVARIAERAPNLVGVKHAVNDLELVSELLAKLGKDFRIFCGLEALSLPMMAIGNLAPGRVAALCDAVDRGDLAEARKLHFELFELNQLIFLDTNPIPLKYMMTRLGLLETPEVRLPLVPLDAERGKILDEALRRAGLL